MPYNFTEIESKCFRLDETVSSLVKSRDKFSHKGDYGHALLIVGSLGKIGAAVLASRACLRSGVGLLSVNLPHCGYDILQSTVPEAMCVVDKNESVIEESIDFFKFDSIGIGPGIGTDDLTSDVVKKLLIDYSKPLMIDADALNIISLNQDIKKISLKIQY